MDVPSSGRTIIFVSFVLVGPELDPDAITSLLGLQPTRSYRRGETMRTRPMHRYPTGSWSLESGLPTSEPIDVQIISLLGRLEGRATEIRNLVHSGLDGGFYCTYSMGSKLGRIRLTSPVLARIGNLDLDITIDVDYEEDETGND